MVLPPLWLNLWGRECYLWLMPGIIINKIARKWNWCDQEIYGRAKVYLETLARAGSSKAATDFDIALSFVYNNFYNEDESWP